MTKLSIHPIAKIFPLIEGKAFDELCDDIKVHGLREPLTVLEGQIVDGRNRYRACEKIGIEPKTVPFRGGDIISFVVSKNLKRRHLKDSQRALIAARIANVPHGGCGRNRPVQAGEIKRVVAAELLNVSTRALDWGKQVEAHAVPELRQLVETGKVSVSAAAKVSKLSESEQRKAVKAGTIAAAARKLARVKGRQGRNEFSIFWKCVDDICDALEGNRLDKAHMAASRLVREIDRVAKSRRP